MKNLKNGREVGAVERGGAVVDRRGGDEFGAAGGHGAGAKREGIEVSVPTLSRFMRVRREKQLLVDAEEMKVSAATFAENGKESKFRAGTLETVRQWMYDRALVIQSPEEARALYAELVKEEAKLRELELEARKVAVAEEQVKVMRLRAEGEIAAKRQKAILLKSERVLDIASEGNGGVKQIGEGNGTRNESAVGEHARLEPGDPSGKRLAEGSEADGKWVKLFSEVMGILNRGGDAAEKLLEARARLAEEIRAKATQQC